MEIHPYLNFNGNCAEAFRCYEKVFGGTIQTLQTHGESPMRDHVSADWQDKVIHATLLVGSWTLMGSDVPPEVYRPAAGLWVSVSLTKKADAERVFHALAESGQVTMPFGATFWSSGFGMTTDRFGTPWMINCTTPA
jgi:PhnB protein